MDILLLKIYRFSVRHCYIFDVISFVYVAHCQKTKSHRNMYNFMLHCGIYFDGYDMKFKSNRTKYHTSQFKLQIDQINELPDSWVILKQNH